MFGRAGGERRGLAAGGERGPERGQRSLPRSRPPPPRLPGSSATSRAARPASGHPIVVFKFLFIYFFIIIIFFLRIPPKLSHAPPPCLSAPPAAREHRRFCGGARCRCRAGAVLSPRFRPAGTAREPELAPTLSPRSRESEGSRQCSALSWAGAALGLERSFVFLC